MGKYDLDVTDLKTIVRAMSDVYKWVQDPEQKQRMVKATAHLMDCPEETAKTQLLEKKLD